jgi:transketolase
VIAVGPLAGLYVAAVEAIPESQRPSLWALAELPLERNPLPAEVLDAIEQKGDLVVAEEHVRRGSFGAELALHLLDRGIHPRRFRHLHARSHQYERYGSQPYLRRQSALDVDAMRSALASS